MTAYPDSCPVCQQTIKKYERIEDIKIRVNITYVSSISFFLSMKSWIIVIKKNYYHLSLF